MTPCQPQSFIRPSAHSASPKRPCPPTDRVIFAATMRGRAEVVPAVPAVATASVRPFEPQARVRVIEQNGALWRIYDARDIARFFSSDRYSCFVWQDDDGTHEQLLDEPLSALEARLATFGFVRIHRGELINLRFLKRLFCATRKCHGRGVVQMHDGQRAPVSRRYMRALRLRLAPSGQAGTTTE